MPTVKFSLNDEYYQQLVDGANERGITIQDYIRNKLFEVTTIFTPSEAVERALRKYSAGDVFTLPQLYDDEWTIERGVAGVFGRQFYKFIENQTQPVIVFDRMVGGSRPKAQYQMI